MAVMDFRDGGHVFSRGDKRREFSYRDDDGFDVEEARYAADPGGDGLSVRIARLTHYLGALVSVALMVGLMVWGWQLVMRDVSGIPVIKAVAGEARTTPDDPGGELTGHTGFAVNTVSGGAEADLVDQVGIAPSATPLDDSDVAMGQLGATAREPAEADLPVAFDSEAVIALQDSEAAAAAARAAAEAEAAALLAEQQRQQALAGAAEAEEQIAAANMTDAPAAEGPVNEVVTDETGAPAQADAIREALTQAQAAGPSSLAVSTRPAPRPRTRTVAAAAPAAAAVQARTAEADAPARRPEAALAESQAEAQAPAPSRSAQVSSGAPLVQIGAFDSDALAAGEFGRMSGKYGNLFAGKGQVIQKHEVNGRTFWRLRVAGFESRAEAQDFCAKLKAAGTDCIPATAQ